MGGVFKNIGLGLCAAFAAFAFLRSGIAFACAVETQLIAHFESGLNLSKLERSFEGAELFGMSVKEALRRAKNLQKQGRKARTIKLDEHFAMGVLKEDTFVIEIIGRASKEAPEKESGILSDLENLVRLEARGMGAEKIHLHLPKKTKGYHDSMTWPFIVYQKYDKVWESNVDGVTRRAVWFDRRKQAVDIAGVVLIGAFGTAFGFMGGVYVVAVPDKDGRCLVRLAGKTIFVTELFCYRKKPVGT